jgi:hypothetical protein
VSRLQRVLGAGRIVGVQGDHEVAGPGCTQRRPVKAGVDDHFLVSGRAQADHAIADPVERLYLVRHAHQEHGIEVGVGEYRDGLHNSLLRCCQRQATPASASVPEL